MRAPPPVPTTTSLMARGQRPHRRSVAMRESHQQQISYWLGQGKSTRDIEELLAQQGVHLSRDTIEHDIRDVRNAWTRDMRRDADTYMMEKLSELRALKREYWDAWFASKGLRQTTIKGSGKANDKDWMHAQIREEKTPGNPMYLEGVRWCIAEENKLLGLHAPVQIETFVRWEAERIAKEYGLNSDDVLAEAEGILKGIA